MRLAFIGRRRLAAAFHIAPGMMVDAPLAIPVLPFRKIIIASIICLAFIGSFDAASTCAAASRALSFFGLSPFGFAFLAGAALVPFEALDVLRARFLVAFLVDMILLLGNVSDGLAAIIRLAEPPANDASRPRPAGVSAYSPSSSIRRLTSSTPNMPVSVSASHSACRAGRPRSR